MATKKCKMLINVRNKDLEKQLAQTNKKASVANSLLAEFKKKCENMENQSNEKIQNLVKEKEDVKKKLQQKGEEYSTQIQVLK